MLAQYLKDVTERWVQPQQKTIPEIIDLFTLERFSSDLDEHTQTWVWRHQPQTMEETLQLVEALSATESEASYRKTPKAMNLVGATNIH